jgi:hypothetical protein
MKKRMGLVRPVSAGSKGMSEGVGDHMREVKTNRLIICTNAVCRTRPRVFDGESIEL